MQNQQTSTLQNCRYTEHEFLLATVNHPANPDHPRILRIERNSNPTIDVNIAKATIGYYDTEDTALNFQSAGAHISQTLVFLEGKNPNFIELISAAMALHRADRDQTTSNSTYSWFAHCLLGVLARNRTYTINTMPPSNTSHFSRLSGLNLFSAGRAKQKQNIKSTEFSLPPGDVDMYYKLFLAAVAEAEKSIKKHADKWTPITLEDVRKAREISAVLKSERDAARERVAVLEREAEVLQQQALELQRELHDLEAQESSTRS